MDLVCNSV